jgi:hypothetical protein
MKLPRYCNIPHGFLYSKWFYIFKSIQIILTCLYNISNYKFGYKWIMKVKKIREFFYIACYLITKWCKLFFNFPEYFFTEIFWLKTPNQCSCNVETHVLIDSLKNHIWRNFLSVIGGNLISMNIPLEKEVRSYTYK